MNKLKKDEIILVNKNISDNKKTTIYRLLYFKNKSTMFTLV